jgi:predicted alpha/beta superfamily hydrolase
MMDDIHPVVLPDSECKILESKIVGDTYKLNIALPEGYYDSNELYPVVYAADGNRSIFTISQITKMLTNSKELPPLIVVGMGYDSDDPAEIFAKRTRDYNPTPDKDHDRRYMKQYGLGSIETGGSDKFLRFILEELKPFINDTYRSKLGDSAYVGHSGGGTFGLYVLFNKPLTFNRYVIGSPTIFRGNDALLRFERYYAEEHDDLNVKLFLSVGEREEKDDPLILLFEEDPEEFRFVTNVKKLSETLTDRGYIGLELTTQIFEDETHLSVIPVTYSRGLRTIFGSR